MMKYKNLRDLYEKRNEKDKIEKAIYAVEKLESYLLKNNSLLNSCTEDELEVYLEILINKKENDLDTILSLARYFYSEKQDEIYIFFAGILGGLGVVENIIKRSVDIIGKEKTKKYLK